MATGTERSTGNYLPDYDLHPEDFVRHYKIVLSRVLNVVGKENRPDAEDAVQEVFIWAILNTKVWPSEGCYLRVLSEIAIRNTRRKLGNRKRGLGMQSDEQDDLISQKPTRKQSTLELDLEVIAELLAKCNTLTPEERQILELLINDRTQTKIAQRLDLSNTTVSRRKREGIAKLRICAAELGLDR